MTETTTATLARWGDGQGLLIPKRFCENLGIAVGDQVDIVATEESLTIVPVRDRPRRTRRLTIEEIFDGYEGTYEPPSDWPSSGNDIDWGAPVGKELW